VGNYIYNLEDDCKEKGAFICGIMSGIMNLRRYLMLPKFEHDTSVNKQDIFNRLEDAIVEAEDLRDSQRALNDKIREGKK